MIVAKVISRVVASAKSERLPAAQLLSVEPLPGYGDPTPIIALAGVEAGPGDTVLVVQEGTAARQVLLPDSSAPLPAQAVIVGIVDEIQLNNDSRN